MSDSAGDMLRETADRLFRDLCPPAALAAAEGGAWPAEAWAALQESGLHRALVPEAAGGFGVTVADALSLLRVAGAHALMLPLAETMLALWLLAGAGLDAPDGPLTAGPVTAEAPPALRRETPGWRIAGTLPRVPWGRPRGGHGGGHAGAVAVLALHAGRPHVALVPAGLFRVEPGENLAREPRDTLVLDAALPPGAVAPSPAGLAELRALGAAMRVQQIAGALQRVRDMTVRYAQDRVQFGRPIGRFQAVQQNLAVLAGQEAAALAAAGLATEAVADGMRLPAIAAAKARAGEAAGIAAGIAHQVHGAIGFTEAHSLHFFTRRLWSWRDEFGNEAEWSLLLGRHLARAAAGEGNAAERLWAALTAI